MRSRSDPFGIAGCLSLVGALVFLAGPYYWLGRDAYVPKSNPDFGYVLPKSYQAWVYFSLALFLLLFGFIISAFSSVSKAKSKST